MKILYIGCRCRIVKAGAYPEMIGLECTITDKCQFGDQWEIAIDGHGNAWTASNGNLEPIMPNIDFATGTDEAPVTNETTESA